MIPFLEKLILSMSGLIKPTSKSQQPGNEFYSMLFEQSPLPQAIVSFQGVHLDANNAYCNLNEIAKQEIVGKTPIQLGLISEEEVRLVSMAFEQSNYKFEDYLVKYPSRSGKLLYVKVFAHRILWNGEDAILIVFHDVTQQRLTEKALRKSELALKENEKLLNGVVQNVAAIIYVIDQDGIFRLSEGLGLSVLGLSPGQVVGASSFDMYADYPDILSAIRRALRGELIVNEVTLGAITFSNRYTTIHDENGEISGILGVSFDISARKRAESENVRLAMVANATNNMVIICDSVGRIEWVNKSFTSISEYSFDEVVGRKPGELLQGRDSDPVVKAFMSKQITEGKGFKDVEVINYTKTGRPYWVSIEVQPIHDSNNILKQFIAIESDVTDRVKSRNELQESELKYRQIIQSCPMGTFVYEVTTANQLIFVDTNQAANSLLSMDNNKLIGKTIEEAFPYLAHTEMPEKFISAARSGTPWYTEDIQYKEGKISGALQVYAFQAGHNRVAVMVQDVTERRQIEEALKQKNDELLKLNAELDRFVYSASHDLRAPIASLLGLVNVARLEKDMNGVEHLLNLQKRTLLKLDNFIGDIVHYSRNSRQEIETEVIDFKPLIEESFEQLQFMEHLEFIERRITVSPGLNVKGDLKRISMILNNLISNAIKYADLNKINPYIEITVSEGAEGIVLCVADNGEGISNEQLPKIFDMFYRANVNSTGSGIGLYIVRETTQKLKGKIEVESVYGEGSKFYVSLPNKI